MRLVWMVGILLGPEGTGHVVGCCLWCQARPGLAYRPSCVVVLVWGWGLRVGRLLRITQWTRASLWSSCQGRTVDALALGADEGRGRPR